MSPRRSSWSCACPRAPWSAASRCVRLARKSDMPQTTVPVEKANSRLMRAMFHTIAPRYDFFTRIFSYGMDGLWKRVLLERARLPAAPVVLDLASGTGDFSLLAARQYPDRKSTRLNSSHL